MKFLKALLLISGIICLLSIAGFFVQTIYLEKELRNAVKDSDALVLEAHTRLVGTSQNLNAILIQVGLASDEARRAAIEQRAYWSKNSQEMTGLLTDARTVLSSVQKTTEDVDLKLDEITQSTTSALDAIPPTLEQSRTTMAAATNSLNAATVLISDPNIPSTLKHIDATAGHIEGASAAIEVRVKQLTKPASLIKQIFTFILDAGSKARVLFY